MTAAALGGVVIALTACSAPAPTPIPTRTIFVTVTATATVTATPAAPAPVAGEPTAPEASPNAPAPTVVLGPASDSGPRTGASGQPTVVDGVLSSYTVVDGDSFFDISQRFDLPQQQLLRMNPQIHDWGQTIYIGMVINIDWTKTG